MGSRVKKSVAKLFLNVFIVTIEFKRVVFVVFHL